MVALRIHKGLRGEPWGFLGGGGSQNVQDFISGHSSAVVSSLSKGKARNLTQEPFSKIQNSLPRKVHRRVEGRCLEVSVGHRSCGEKMHTTDRYATRRDCQEEQFTTTTIDIRLQGHCVTLFDYLKYRIAKIYSGARQPCILLIYAHVKMSITLFTVQQVDRNLSLTILFGLPHPNLPPYAAFAAHFPCSNAHLHVG